MKTAMLHRIGGRDVNSVNRLTMKTVLTAAALILIVGFGVVRLPLETRLTQEERAASFSKVKLDIGLREKLGQLGFLAALSGFRTLVADLLWIEANTAWQQVEYGKMNLLLKTVTTLAPQNVLFWDDSAWHMAYNASVMAMDDRTQPKIALRKIAQREYFELGKEYAEHGIRNIPNSYLLHQRLALINKDKFQDHCAASKEFTKAAECPGALPYLQRFAAYEMSYCPGHERLAWQMLRSLYLQGEQQRLPELEKRLKAMEEQLNIPQDQRTYRNS